VAGEKWLAGSGCRYRSLEQAWGHITLRKRALPVGKVVSEFLTVADFNESSFTARGPSNKKGAH